MAENIKIKVDKRTKRVEVELGEEKVAFTFDFLQQLAVAVMSDKSAVFEKEIPLK